jgi:REP element-mobilizing transposase RayT
MYFGPNRKLNRLKGFDYTTSGWYFLTICVKNRTEFFGEVKNEKMILNKFGKIIDQQVQWLLKNYAYVNLDEYVIMPNHIHMILIINPLIKNGHAEIVSDIVNVGNSRDCSLQVRDRLGKTKSLSEIVGAFKTTSSKIIHLNNLPEFKWQKSFYDRIIRNEQSFRNIKKYIRENPRRWEQDRNNSENLYM